MWTLDNDRFRYLVRGSSTLDRPQQIIGRWRIHYCVEEGISCKAMKTQSPLTIDVIVDTHGYLHDAAVISRTIPWRGTSPTNTDGELIGKPESPPLECRG